jgi:hypothetical protein
MSYSDDALLLAIEQGNLDDVKANVAGLLIFPEEKPDIPLFGYYHKLRRRLAFLTAVFDASTNPYHCKDIFELIIEATISHVGQDAIREAMAHCIDMDSWNIVDSIVGRLVPNFFFQPYESRQPLLCQTVRLESIKLKHMKRILNVKHNIAV